MKEKNFYIVNNVFVIVVVYDVEVKYKTLNYNI